jgi:hypothetical protein
MITFLPSRLAACLAALGLAALSATTAVAQTPTFTIVNTGLDATFGNAGKGIFDPQVLGLTGVAFGAGLFVAIGNSAREDAIRWATSPDGTTWTPRTQILAGGMRTFTNSKVHFLNGKFMFFAAHSTTSAASSWCYTSADGLSWTANKVADARIAFEEFDASPTLTVVAGTNGGQMASSDLVTWTNRPVIPNGAGYDHNDLAYGNGRFFSSINGFGGTTYSSTDAAVWTSIAGGTVAGGSRVETGNGLVLISGAASRYRSTDGTTFTAYTPRTSAATIFLSGNDGRFTNGRFITTATDFANARSLYVWSTDGLSWSPLANAATAPTSLPGTSRSYGYADIAFGNGKYVLVGVDVTFAAASTTYLPLVTVLDASLVPAAPTPPVITAQPATTGAVLGRSATLSVAATGTGNTYQWRKDGATLAGATAASYTIATVTAASAGSYTVVITNASGSTTSTAAALTLVSAADVSRVSNLSVRTTLEANQILTVGFTMSGGAKNVLVRAAGPGLGALGVSDTMVDPKLALFNGSTQINANDNWAGNAAVAAAGSAVGAFPFASTTSLDAALVATVDSGRTVQVSGPAAGNLIVEVYDAGTGNSPRLTNLSALNHVGTGADVLIAGFTIAGLTTKNILIRAVGPTLGRAPFNIGGTLADPKLEIYNSNQAKIGENDTYAANLAPTFASVGAFALAAGSKDAAVIVSLPPGGYTVQVSGADGGTGIAIIELYELP